MTLNKISKNIIFFLLTFTLTLFFIAAMFETVSYFSLTPEERKTTPADLISKNKNAYLVQFSEFDCNFIETILVHSVLGFTHRKLQYRNPNCKAPVNNIGMQSFEDLPLIKNNDEYNIMILGGSVAEQLFDYAGSNFRPKLENILNQKFVPPNGKKKFHLYIGAMGQWAMPNQVNMLQMYSERIDGAISIDGYNESLSISSGRRHESTNLPTMLMSVRSYDDPIFYLINFYKKSREYIINSRLRNLYSSVIYYRFLTAKLQNYIFSKKVEDEFANYELSTLSHEQAQEWSLSSLERYNKNLHSLAKANNIAIAQFLQPNRYLGKTLTENEKKYNDYSDLKTMIKISNMYDHLKNSNFAVSNLTELFKDEYGDIYSDHIHYIQDYKTQYSKGYELMAEKISNDLQKLWKLKSK